MIDVKLADMMAHALGWPKCYRNRFCADVTSEDAQGWEQLVALGLAERGPLINEGRARYYRVTEAGRKLLRDEDAASSVEIDY